MSPFRQICFSFSFFGGLHTGLFREEGFAADIVAMVSIICFVAYTMLRRERRKAGFDSSNRFLLGYSGIVFQTTSLFLIGLLVPTITTYVLAIPLLCFQVLLFEEGRRMIHGWKPFLK